MGRPGRKCDREVSVKVGLGLFISSVVFALTIAVAYWFVAHEIVGVVLLGFMAFGLCVIAGYMIGAEHDADLWGDDATATMQDAATEVVGTFTIRSPLPFMTAFAITCVGLGLVVSPTIAVLGLLTVLALGVAFIVQSQ